MTAIADPFLNNRADALSSDSLFSQFIVPPFFQRISIFADKGSVRILGGRGCGKTMFIRYFSHGSAFNAQRQDIPESELKTVGLYLRPDTGFCGLMIPEWLGGTHQAKLAFSHYVALNLLRDAVQALESIRGAHFANGSIHIGDPMLSVALVTQLGLTDQRVSHLDEALEIKLVELESWVRNPKHSPPPLFVSFTSVLPRFARDIVASCPALTDLAFRAFIDEFENLQNDHREVVCDAIKHPSSSLVVHIAHKKQAVVDFKTSSDERVVEGHDLRTIDLEEELSKEGDFELLAAELFLLRVHQGKGRVNCPLFNPSLLHDPRHLEHRLSKPYREQILRCVREILPSPSSRDIAREVIEDGPLRRRLREMIQKGLVMQGLEGTVDAEDLISSQQPQASIVLGAVLNRRSQIGKDVISQYRAAVANPSDADPFFKIGGWIDNNLHGCLFHLYAGLPRRPNINYAGFERFCMLADPNLRFFQALCHATLSLAYKRQSGSDVPEHLKVSADIQAIAAKQVSDKLFQDILQLGANGSKLLEITGRLGRVFEAFNRRRSQSEPEVNHFSIDNANRSSLSTQAEQLLREAKIWSVLYEAKDTKNKSDYDIAQTDLILNPIYAPHFGISFRKRRKVTLRAPHADILLCQSTSQYEAVLKTLVDPSEQEPSETTPDLF